MIDRFPVDTLYYPTIVTRDAKAMAKRYANFYGITRWKVSHQTTDRLKDATIFGRVRSEPPKFDMSGRMPAPNEYSFISAIGRNESGGVTFQLVQPTSGVSTFEEFLSTRGQGIHSLCLAVIDRKDIPELKSWLAGQNIGVAQSFTFGKADWYYFDTRQVLGYFYLQVIAPHTSDWESAVQPDEEWDFSNEIERPDVLSFMAEVSSITHFGVVVDRLSDRLENFARLFGVGLWRGMHWRTEEGSLEDTTNNGKPVVHGYFTGRADIGKTPLGGPFGFEVIQPTFGPSHYKEDYLNVLGPGIHHLDLRWPIREWSQWDTVNGWLANAMAAPTCMSGWLRNRVTVFHYQDTRSALGYVTEIHPPPRSDRTFKPWAPDFWYDFSAKASA